jgi:hypothetical protein
VQGVRPSSSLGGHDHARAHAESADQRPDGLGLLVRAIGLELTGLWLTGCALFGNTTEIVTVRDTPDLTTKELRPAEFVPALPLLAPRMGLETG